MPSQCCKSALEPVPVEFWKLDAVDKEIARYEAEKEVIRLEAVALAGRLRAFEHEEHLFEYAATVAELAIVLAGVALLLHSRRTLYGAVCVAAVAVVIVAYTSVTGVPDDDESADGAPAAHADAGTPQVR